MKKCLRKEILIGVLIISIIFSMVLIVSAGGTEKNGCAGYAETQDARDGYKYTSHEPIYINGNDDFVVGQNGVVSGSGNEGDPYIIENWDINASSAHGIDIRNTDVYFIIRNCCIHDGSHNYQGVYFVSSVQNGKIDNVTSYNNFDGIYLGSGNNIITNCDVYNNYADGIRLVSSNNDIGACNIYNNGRAISIWYSSHNSISTCYVHNNSDGIEFYDSSYNKLRDNILENNTYNLQIDGGFISLVLSHFYQDIDASNTINSKPICYIINQSNLVFDDTMSIGYLGIVSCTNITIKNLELKDNSQGLLMANTTYSKVLACNVYNNLYGIELFSSLNNNISTCSIYNNSDGIRILYSSKNNIIDDCDIYHNGWGNYLWNSSNNNITSNQIYNNYYGVYLDYSSNYEIHYNNIYNNTNYGVYSYGYTVNATYNWWGNATGPYHPDTNPDGTGDIVTDNVIYDPWLTEPWEEVTGPVHNIDKDTYYDTIQEAIDDANSGDTIEVSSGTYYENVIINKTLTLIGEDKNNTIIDGGGTGDVIYISADWVNVSGFGVKNSGPENFQNHDAGIDIQSSNNQIKNCVCYDNYYGIHLELSLNNYIINCIIYNNSLCGIYLKDASDNTILNSTIYCNSNAIFLYHSSNTSIINSTSYNNYYGGISLSVSSNSTIKNCVFHNNSDGISLSQSPDNIIINCTTCNNYHSGITLCSSSANTIANCTSYNNNWNGIYLHYLSDGNIIIDSIVYNNYKSGITLQECTEAILDNNTISNNTYNFGVVGYELTQFYHDINQSNTINGKPIYYIKQENGLIFDNNTNIGYLGLISCNNVQVKNLSAYGILLANASFASVINCNSSHSISGFQLSFSSNTTILNCYSYNNGVGISIWESSDNHIANCICNNNSEGMQLLFSSSNNTIMSSMFYNNDFGIFLCDSSNCNQIMCCDVANNVYAVYIYYDEYGVGPCISSIFCRNNFINNTNNVYDECSNFWDNGTEGNYWGDYTGIDNDGDGIGDTPYNISGGANKDNYPLIHEVTWWDTEAPAISLISPNNNSIIKPGTILEFEINDDNLWKASYSVNGGEAQLFSSPYNLSTAGWSDGTHNIMVYAKDWGMNEISKMFTFTIDSILPEILLIHPSNNSVIPPETILDFDIHDSHLKSSVYSVHDYPIDLMLVVPSYPLNFPYNISTTGWSGKTYAIVIYVNDTAGNEFSKWFVFTIDGTSPTITIAESSQTTNKKTFTMSWSSSEEVQYYEVSADGINWVNVSTSTQHTFTLSKGANTLYVRGTDLAGNKGTDMITVTYQEKKQGKPGIIPGFEIASLLVVLGICIILLRRKLS